MNLRNHPNRILAIMALLACMVLSSCEWLGITAPPPPTQRDNAMVAVDYMQADGKIDDDQADLLREFIEESADGIDRRDLLIGGVNYLVSTAKMSAAEGVLAKLAIDILAPPTKVETADASSPP